jgi:membrane protein
MTTLDAGHVSGRFAATPSELGIDAWKDILWRTYNEFVADRITLIAAGATFYLLLALFPALAAFVSFYGFVADPVTIADHIAFLGGVLPQGGMDLIRSQLLSLAQQNNAALSFGFIFGIAFALWSANNGIKTLFEALNVAYDETEKRSFVWLNVFSLLFTLAAIVIGILFIVAVGVVPALLAFVGLSGWEELLISLLRWPILFIAAAAGICVLYRYGPSRELAKWRWITWGSLLATALWLIASVLFSWYLANFADYNATYGSLGAVIGFMMWTWISVVILLLGAELDSEMEHQTARDSTTGAEVPIGMRGATMADTLGENRHSASAQREAKQKSEEPAKLGDDEGAPLAHSVRVPPPPRYSPRQILMGYAVPVAAVGAVAAMEFLDRRSKERRSLRSPTPPSRHPAKPRVASALLAEWPRALLADPELRRRILAFTRLASDFASQAATARQRAKSRWWR